MPLALHGHTTWVTAVAFSADGELLASGSGDQTIRLWHPRTGEVQRTLCGHHDWIYGVAFSPAREGETLLASCGADTTICVWDVQSGQLIQRLRGHTHAVRSVAFSPDGSMLASGSTDATVKLWDVRTGLCLDTLRAPRPYEGVQITSVTGITEAQRTALRSLGAVE